jgi:hypothetical protein
MDMILESFLDKNLSKNVIDIKPMETNVIEFAANALTVFSFIVMFYTHWNEPCFRL